MQIETNRMLLRPWEEGDAAALYRYASDPRVGPSAGWAPHESEEESREIIRTVLSEPETCAVVFKETGEPVGSVGIMPARREGAGTAQDEAEIGYWIGVPYWGRGLIPEAVEALLARCFTVLGCERVWCAYFDGNEKSHRVQEKCGFVYDHTEYDVPTRLENDFRTEHFSKIEKAQWEARQAQKSGGR